VKHLDDCSRVQVKVSASKSIVRAVSVDIPVWSEFLSLLFFFAFFSEIVFFLNKEVENLKLELIFLK